MRKNWDCRRRRRRKRKRIIESFEKYMNKGRRLKYSERERTEIVGEEGGREEG